MRKQQDELFELTRHLKGEKNIFKMATSTDHISVNNQVDESSVTLFVLNSEADAETYKKRDVLHVEEFVIPQDATLDDLVNLIWDMIEKEFPFYQGEIECQFLERDMLRATLEIKKLTIEEQLEPSDITPAFALRRVGRIFVVLCEPLRVYKTPATATIKKTRSDSSTRPFLEDNFISTKLRIVTPRSRHTKEESQLFPQECAKCSTATGDAMCYDLNDHLHQHIRRVKNLHETYAHLLDSVMQPN